MPVYVIIDIMFEDRKIYLVVGVAFLAGLFLGFVSGTSVELAGNARVGADKTVSVMIDYGDGTLKTYTDLDLSDKETVLEKLQELADNHDFELEIKEYAGLGALVERIGPKKNGAGEKYWQYWVNNGSPQVGADAYVLSRGDVVEWKFIGYQEPN